MDIGLLIVRLVVGLLLAGYGAQKLFGWFGGDGLAGTGEYLESLGFRPGRPFATLSGLAEGGAGLLIALGLASPLAATAVVANFLCAYRGHAGKGVWSANGGWELPLLYGTVGAALGFTGFGDYGLDGALGWNLAGTGWGAAALAAGVVVALGAQLAARRPAVRSSASSA